MQAAIIPADITAPIRFEDITPDLDTFQGLVGGDIQMIGLQRYAMNMYLNENGKLERLAPNHRATVLANWSAAIRSDDIIAGDVVLTGPVDDAGNDTPIVDTHKWWLLRFDDEQAQAAAHGIGD